MRLWSAAIVLLALVLALAVDAKKKSTRKPTSKPLASSTLAPAVVRVYARAPHASLRHRRPSAHKQQTASPGISPNGTTPSPHVTAQPAASGPGAPSTATPSTVATSCILPPTCLDQLGEAENDLQSHHAGFTFDDACQALKTIQADFWSCAYSTNGPGYCDSFNTCLDLHCFTNDTWTLDASPFADGQTGTCAYSDCAAFCASTPPPTVTPSASLTPTDNSTCEFSPAETYCFARVPVVAQNSSDFATACASVKLQQGYALSCMYASTQFGNNCSYAACLAETCTDAATLPGINALLTTEAQDLSGGQQQLCQYATCQEACTANAYSSGHGVVSSSAVIVVVVWSINQVMR